MLHAQNTPAAVAAAAVAAGHQLLASTAAGFDSHDDVAGNASPSKTLMKPPLNLGHTTLQLRLGPRRPLRPQQRQRQLQRRLGRAQQTWDQYYKTFFGRK